MIEKLIDNNHILCEYGCNKLAQYKLNNGKYCCSESTNSCSAVKKKNGTIKLVDKICPYCQQEFKQINVRTFANHVRWCPKNPKHEECSGQKFKDKLLNTRKKKFNSKHGELKTFEVECHLCKTKFNIQEYENDFPTKERYFCSIKCRNSRILTTEIKQKISNTINKQKIYLKEYDLKEYNRRFGLRGNNNKFTSKSERLIRDYIIQMFPNDEWTYGGHLIINNVGISRDLYSKKLRICFEYDGIWHFKNIHNQLQLKQLKDQALEQWCINNNYRLIRISESWFYEHNNNPECIIPLLYNSNEKILKLGNEYNIF